MEQKWFTPKTLHALALDQQLHGHLIKKGHNVEFIAGPEGFEPKKSKLNKE